MVAKVAKERPNTLQVLTSEDVVRVRQEVRNRAAAIGLSLVDQTKFVTAASEIARNTIVHGGGGSVLIEVVNDRGKTGLKLTFEDDGRGIADLDQAMQDGFSTGGGLGMGLPGAKRLSSEFELSSTPGQGTRVVLIRWKTR
jgi:serine/threonine-protein kinase RsbT